MQIRNHHDLWSGIMFAAFGLLFMFLSQQYQMGTAAKMGPAYFPTVLGGLLAVLGLIIGLGAYSKNNHESAVAPVGWREIGLVLLAVALFAIFLPFLGMVVSIVVLVMISSLASHEFRLRDTFLSVVVLLAMSYLVFVKGLELQFRVLPKFIVE